MRWFKHFTTAMDDLFVIDLERKFGDSGYAFWFKTLELMGAHGEDGKLTITWRTYAEKLNGKRRDHLRRMLTFTSSRTRLTFAETENGLLTICIPKFAELCDNYSKYGGLSLKRLQRQKPMSLKQEAEEEVDKKEKKIKEPEDILSAFLSGEKAVASGIMGSEGFKVVWLEWNLYRREKKKSLTERTAVMQLKFLAEQSDPIACINQSIRNGWQGVFELKENYASNNGSDRAGNRRAGGATTAADLRRSSEMARKLIESQGGRDNPPRRTG